jgi:hypothetical protein
VGEIKDDVRDGENFIAKWLNLIEIAAEVECNNRYDCIDYNTNKIMKYKLVLGYNLSRFDMNFLINILHDPPNHHVESIIGKLIYLKQVTVMTAVGICMKFLDAMNYALPQTLDSFVKTFGDKKNLQKVMFEYNGFNSSNFISVQNQTISFEEQNFHSNLKNSDTRGFWRTGRRRSFKRGDNHDISN